MRYIVKEDDGYNWARWIINANSEKELIDWWNENGLDEDNAELIDHTPNMPYSGKIEIEGIEEKKLTLERIKNISKDIIRDDTWVNDSHSRAEHRGVKDGLERLIRHLEETEESEVEL